MITTTEKLEKDENWKEALDMMEREYMKGKNPKVLISLIFILWYISIEGKGILRREDLENKISFYFKISERELSNDTDYLIFVGWCVNLEYWDFPNANEGTGKEMVAKAMAKSNNKNPFEVWISQIFFKSNTGIPTEYFAENAYDTFVSEYVDYCYTLKDYFKSLLEQGIERFKLSLLS